jgi:hypothetical protein
MLDRFTRVRIRHYSFQYMCKYCFLYRLLRSQPLEEAYGVESEIAVDAGTARSEEKEISNVGRSKTCEECPHLSCFAQTCSCSRRPLLLQENSTRGRTPMRHCMKLGRAVTSIEEEVFFIPQCVRGHSPILIESSSSACVRTTLVPARRTRSGQ